MEIQLENWTEFKAEILKRRIKMDYYESSALYFVWAQQRMVIYTCKIKKDGSTDQLDFGANYKAKANQPNSIEHWNGTATSTEATVTFSSPSVGLILDVAEVGADLKISFDDGANWKTIKPGTNLSIDVSNYSVKIKTDDGTVDYEMAVIT